MKNNLCSLLLLSGMFATASTFSATAQNNKSDGVQTASKEDLSGPVNIELAARVDYQRDYRESISINDNSGFKGKYLMFTMNGNITDKFSYSFRQRLNELHHKNSFFDGTDAMWLKYRFNKRWDITGGKMALAFGSYEYQRDPMEMYFASEFWNTIPCYKFAVSIGCNVTDNDRLVAQFSESPFKKKDMDLYGYTFAWYGNHHWFKTVYSANVLEYQPGNYIYYLCLGHRIEFGKMALELDYMNRATKNHNFLFKDCSVTGELSVQPNDKWNVFAKASYSCNNTFDPADACVWPGTDVTHVGGGMEFYPLPNGNKSIRVHAAYNYSFGDNTNPDGINNKDQHFMSVGVLWRMDIVDLAKKIFYKDK